MNMNAAADKPSLWIFLTLCALAATGCGWGYAGQHVGPDPVQPAPPEDAAPPTALADKAQVGAPAPEEPCPVKLFTLFKVEQGSRTIKDIQCDSGQILSLSRKDISADDLRGYVAMNVPLERWYLLVDPRQERQISDYALTNQQLMGLTRRYPFKFYHRMPDNGFIIYTLEDASPAPSEAP
jgi:hypothetical protein